MPIRECPFTKIGKGTYPILNLRIINPHTNKHVRTYGLIDTGADTCGIPASYAISLGHNLKAGTKNDDIGGAGGEVISYLHTTEIELYHPATNNLLLTIPTNHVDYVVGLPLVLLGVSDFLGSFILNIDYPSRIFSVITP